MQSAVFLDLEKTIIEDPFDPSASDTITLIKGAAPAIASLRGLGYQVIVAANHDEVARGHVSIEEIETLHATVAGLIEATASGAAIDAFYYCPFHPKGVVDQYKQDHPNRKPKPGMLKQAAHELSLDLASSWMIGDELADVQAGHAAGSRTVLLRPDADRLNPVDPATIEGVVSEPADTERPAGPDFFAVGLVDAARLIAQQPRVESAEVKQQSERRKWDSAKIAKLQVPRPKAAEQSSEQAEPAKAGSRSFRPWDAPAPQADDEKPIVSKPYRRKQQAISDVAPDTPVEVKISQPQATDEPLPAPKPQDPPQIPAAIQQAIKNKESQGKRRADDSEEQKLLRMILQELRAQRGLTQEFSFLTIVAVALQLIAIVCLLGGLFMGSGDDGLFLRWLGAGLIVQLTAIGTLLYGR